MTALTTILTAIPTFRIKVPSDCAGITGNGNSSTTRWGLNPEGKKCPAPWSHSSSHRLSILSTPFFLAGHYPQFLPCLHLKDSRCLQLSNRKPITKRSINILKCFLLLQKCSQKCKKSFYLIQKYKIFKKIL